MGELSKRQEVLNELQLVLEKHNAAITVDDHWQGYAECGQDLRITIEIDDDEDIELGSCLDHLTSWDCLET